MASSTNDRKRKIVDNCPYLDTIQRNALDFDFAPCCSVTMDTGPHIYACLVCGAMFRGRGPQTPAMIHSVEASHFVYIHLASGRFYCLPDNYELNETDSNSLNDIRLALHPTFTTSQIAQLDTQHVLSRDLFGRVYLPGFVGFNNLSKTDGINAVVQALAHVPPLRNFFLSEYNMNGQAAAASSATTSKNASHGVLVKPAQDVTRAFATLVRQLWSPYRFKSHVDPHALVHAIMSASHKRFQVGVQAEAGELLPWLLHQLHLGTLDGGKNAKKPGSSIVQRIFQGHVRVTTRRAKKRAAVQAQPDPDDRAGSDRDDDDDDDDANSADNGEAVTIDEKVSESRFMHLTLDIPEKPLFRDEDGGLVIPQEPLVNVLSKFDGRTYSDVVTKTHQRKKYELLQLPSYLILHLARFTKNGAVRRKNPAIVAFPVKNLDLTRYVTDDFPHKGMPSEVEIRAMKTKELKHLLFDQGRPDLAASAVEKPELVQTVLEFCAKNSVCQYKYDLVANITHSVPADVGREGTVDPLQAGSYQTHVQAGAQWYELQDLHVETVMPQQIGVSESYVLVLRRSGSVV